MSETTNAADVLNVGIESFTELRWVTVQHTGRPSYPF